MADLTKLQFYSKANYLKGYIDVEAYFTFTGSSDDETYTGYIDHNLGFAPLVSIAYTIDDDSTYWTNAWTMGDTFDASQNFLMFTRSVSWQCFADTNRVYVAAYQARNRSGQRATGNRKFKLRIYLDYGGL